MAKQELEKEIEFMDPEETEETENEENAYETENGETEDEFEEELESEGEDSDFGVWSRDTAGKKGLKVLLYGQSGVGKTRMAATAPRPLFLDLEDGLRSTLAVKPVLRYPADPVETISSYTEVVDFYKLVKRAKNPTWDTVVIDSLNELQVLVTQNIVSRFSNVRRQYDDQLTMADYGKANRDFMKVIRLLIKLPYHIIFTAASTEREPGDEEIQLTPKFVGKQVGPELRKLVDLIGYCHAKRMKDGSSQHYVSFKISPGYVAKDRLDIVDRDIPNDFQILVDAANAKEQE